MAPPPFAKHFGTQTIPTTPQLEKQSLWKKEMKSKIATLKYPMI